MKPFTSLHRRLRRSGYLSIVAASLMTSAVFANEPVAELDGYTLFGISSATGELGSYNFANDEAKAVGEVRLAETGQLVTGIEASAYIPRSANVLAFWSDPADGETKLLQVNLESAKARVVSEVGTGAITGAVAVTPTETAPINSAQRTPLSQVRAHEVYAVQSSGKFDFDIVNNAVVPRKPFVTKVTVLGAAIRSGSYDMPVTIQVHMGNDDVTPFGGFGSPTAGNLNDGAGVRRKILEDKRDANTPITITAKSWIKESSSYSGSSDSHWGSYLSFNSADGGQQVKVLRNGDDVPNIAGMDGQSNIAHFVRDFVDTASGKMKMADNQVIYLFELGTTNMSSSAADFQDLVVLVTLAKNAEDLQGADNVPVAGHLIKVDHHNGNKQRVMPLSHSYDSLAGYDATTLYGTSGNELYKIDLANKTETLLATLGGELAAMEWPTATLFGFENATDRLHAVINRDMAAVNASVDVRLNDLGSIIFARDADLPLFQRYD